MARTFREALRVCMDFPVKTMIRLVDLRYATRAPAAALADAAHRRKDYTTAVALWRSLAELGNASAQYNLGLMYKNGLGVPQDTAAAMFWYEKAADQGEANAQINLGAICTQGARWCLRTARWR
jgi:TPR repeat protein